jgi:uncharacterized membrane protein
MADFPAPPPAAGTGANPPVSGTLLAYALFAVAGIVGLIHSGLPVIAPLLGLVGIAGLIVCYVNRGGAQGTWVATHLTWLIRTFWYSLLWTVIGWTVFWVLLIILIGPVIAVAIWVVAYLWVLYRVLRGYLLFKDSKPIPGD